MTVKFLQRNIFQRIFGICATEIPNNADGWNYAAGQLTINLERIPELTRSGTAVRFEGKNLPERILVIREEDGSYRALKNRCTHLGHRRLDYVPGTGTVQCCSVSKSTYTLTGETIYGPAPQPIQAYPVEMAEGKLRIRISPS